MQVMLKHLKVVSVIIKTFCDNMQLYDLEGMAFSQIRCKMYLQREDHAFKHGSHGDVMDCGQRTGCN